MKLLILVGLAVFMSQAGQSATPSDVGRQAGSGERELAPVQDYDVPPKVVRMVRPEYPLPAIESGIEGTVLVEMVIDERGRVTHTRILKSIDGLNEAALSCVRQWRFRPAQKRGKPVATTAQAPVTFKRPSRPNGRT